MNLSQPNYIEPRTGVNHLELSGCWNYTYRDTPTDQLSDLAWNLQTQVPNSIFWSLHESGVLPHPYKGCNSKAYHWVDEKLWYYKLNFMVGEEKKHKQAFLCIDGAAYYCRVWLNGRLLGSHEGMFGGPIVEVAGQLNYGGPNELVIEIKACNYGQKATWSSWNEDGSNTQIVPWNAARDTRTGNGHFIVLGLWRGIRIEFLPELHLSRPYMTTVSVSGNQAKLHLSCEIAREEVHELKMEQNYKLNWMDYTFHTFHDGLTGINTDEKVTVCMELTEKHSGCSIYRAEETVFLYDYEKSGINSRFYQCQLYNTDLIIDNPKLWFPNHMGEPFLYTVSLTLLKDGQIYDRHSFDYGIRTVELEYAAGEQYCAPWGKYQLVVNGQKLFLKGMNWAPLDCLYKLEREDYRWAIELARNAGIQLLRVWSGGGLPETDDFYELCDEMGIMVWQDSFLANMETPCWPQDILQAQVCMNLYRIRNHPSLAVHCGGNEFNPYAAGNAASMFVIERSIRDLDPSRPFIRTSPDQGSVHIYNDMEPVWYRHLYKQLPFIGESGIHSFPNLKSLRQLISPDEYNRPLPDIFAEAFRAGNPELLNHFSEYEPVRVPRMVARASQINPVKGSSLADLVEASQLASCEFYQIMIQAVRENYPVTAGIMPWVFKRPWTTIGIQLVDGMGDPIAPYYYVKKAYQPLMISVGLEYLAYAPGDEVNLPVAVINESGQSLMDAAYELQVLDDKLQVVYEKVQAITVLAGDYKCVYQVEPFRIPENYSEKFFLVRAALITKQHMVAAQSIYWPKSLECMKQPETRHEYRSKPQQNFYFDKGPWLKKQMEAAAKAELACSVISVVHKGSRISVSLEVGNSSDQPAFPVKVDVVEDGTVCYLNDNYYFHNRKEIKLLHVEIYRRNPHLALLHLEISAWNANRIIEIIRIPGYQGEEPVKE
ncbi:MAG: beta-mannosidase [Paenibacillaceae bacterium]|jgi:beta-mannosidase|nr:beta-mannosidase [Paenibacillaceae bacterium]